MKIKFTKHGKLIVPRGYRTVRKGEKYKQPYWVVSKEYKTCRKGWLHPKSTATHTKTDASHLYILIKK